MSVSNDTYAWFVRNRIVTLEMMADDFMEYVQEGDKSLATCVYGSNGFFTAVSLAADGNDKFKLEAPFNPETGILDGHEVMDLDALQSDMEGIQFENASAIDYHVGLRRAVLVEGIEVNPKDGLPNWSKARHLVGRQGYPDAVVDNGNGTITFTVDGITEAGVSNAGRTVKALKFMPAKGAITDAIAVETLTVAWDGSNNKVTTAGAFGQTAISTTPSDYAVTLIGPHVLRNTDISTDTDYAYVGTVQGAGAGNPPAVFDTTGQFILFRSISNLWHVLREVNVGGISRWKIDVKAIAGESGVDQIRVTDSASAVKFSVDEAGNVTVEGDLDVKGTTTTRDVDQVNAYNAYFDNLDAGNTDTDTHNIKGEWTHTSSGGGITAFAIDGDTGKVGIGGTYDAAYALKVTGSSFYTDDLIPAAAACLGSPTAYWCDIYATTYHIGGALLPDVTDSFEIGESTTPLKWRNLYLSGTAYADTGVNVASSAIVGDATQLKLSDIPLRISATGVGTDEKNWALEIVSGANEVLTLATKGDAWGAGVAFFEAKRTIDSTAIELLTLTATEVSIAGNLLPSGATRLLGDASNHWQKFYLSNAADHGVATHLVPATTALNLGNVSYPWQRLYLADSLGNGVINNLVPASTGIDLGNAARPWQKLFLAEGANIGVATNLVPAVLTLNLGNGSRPWQRLFLSAGDGNGVAGTLVSTGDGVYDFGTATKRWKDIFASGTVEGGQFKATDLVGSGGGADTVTFTAGTAATAGPGATVLAGGNQNAGFVKIFVANTVGYLAYWTTIT